MPQTKKNKKIVYVVCAVVLLIAIGVAGYIYATYPKLTYKLTTTSATDAVEQPLNVTTTALRTSKKLSFSIKFIEGAGENETAHLSSGFNVTLGGKFPLVYPKINYSDNLTVKLSDNNDQPQKTFALYTLSGDITNLQVQAYKLSVLDSNGNLIDQKYITVVE
jgi:hypothetical protein